MNFKFANLLGAPYRGGNLILHGSQLLTPVGNRVSEVSQRSPAARRCGACMPLHAAAQLHPPHPLQSHSVVLLLNRQLQINLSHSTSQTLPFENLKQVCGGLCVMHGL